MTVEIGWKVFFFGMPSAGIMRRWLTSKVGPGWHVWQRAEDAERYVGKSEHAVVLPVALRNYNEVDYAEHGKGWIAQEIQIL